MYDYILDFSYQNLGLSIFICFVATEVGFEFRDDRSSNHIVCQISDDGLSAIHLHCAIA